MRYSPIVNVLLTEDDGWQDPSLNNHTEVLTWKLSNILLWTGSAQQQNAF